jgi:hypothetical protein
MATVNKDFKVKNGLIVEGTTAKVNNFDILTKKQADQDYIVGLIGGTATSANTANTVVKRDANGDFAAGTITADITGQVSDISNHSTSDLTEGTNLYYTDARARLAIAAGTGIDYNSSTGYIDANLGTGLGLDGSSQIEIDRTVVDTWYDEAGSASDAQAAAELYADGLAQTAAGDLSDHEGLTFGVHGVTGSVVGTTDTQDISNKRIIDTLYFTDGVTVNNEAEIEVQSGSHLFNIQANEGDLNLRTTALGASVYVISDDADIVLAADGGSYIGTVAAENEIATKSYADGAADSVQTNLDNHASDTSTHGVTEILGATEAQTISNKTLGSDLAAGGYKVSGLLDPSANQDAATKSYVDTAVSNLIGAAPELLDTLNELAEAIGDDEDFIGTITASIGEKVAKAGDSMSGDLDFGGTNKVTSLAAPTNSGDAANKNYVDTEISTLDTAAQGYADDAETAANLYTDGRETAITTAYQNYADQAEADAESAAAIYTDGEITTALSTAQGYANTAEQNAKDYADDEINALSTTDIEEGLNLYFTNQRAIDAVGGTIGDAIDELNTDDIEEGSTNLYHTSARAKSAAAELLTGASLTNITITGTGAGLTITAENGVADSTTSDLAEGSRLYFTAQRAVDALEAVVPNFTEVDINSLATQVAATVSVPTASANNVAYAFAKADYRSAEFLVKTAYSTHTEISKVLLTLDTADNIAITEYGIVGTNGASMTISADIDGANVRLLVTTANNTSTVTVVGTLLA